MLTRQEIEVIKDLLLEGVTPFQIAHKLGRSLTTIYKLRNNQKPFIIANKSQISSKMLPIFDSHLQLRIKQGITNLKNCITSCK